MRARIGGAVLFLALFALLGLPAKASAQGGECWKCEGNDCVAAAELEFGGTEPCETTWTCHDGQCSEVCSPGGQICGPEAVAMSGQVVLPADVDPAAVRMDTQESVLRRGCDGAIVVLEGRKPLTRLRREAVTARIELR